MAETLPSSASCIETLPGAVQEVHAKSDLPTGLDNCNASTSTSEDLRFEIICEWLIVTVDVVENSRPSHGAN